MAKPVPATLPLMASSNFAADGSEEEEYWWWGGKPGHRAAVVFRFDRFGQRWTLDLAPTDACTLRVAAGLIDVTVMTLHAWIRRGKLSGAHKRKGTLVLPMHEVERIAAARDTFVRYPLTPEQRRLMKTRTVKLKKGGGKNADKG